MLLGEETVIAFNWFMDHIHDIEPEIELALRTENPIDWLIDCLHQRFTEALLTGVVNPLALRMLDAATQAIDWQWIADELISARIERRMPELPQERRM